MAAQQKGNDKAGLRLLFVKNGSSRHFRVFFSGDCCSHKIIRYGEKKVKCLLLCTIASVKMNCAGQRKYSERLHINKAVKELFRYFFSTSAEGKSIVKK